MPGNSTPQHSYALCLLAGVLALAGCAVPEPATRPPFHFESDTFAYTNDNYWHYELGPRSGAPIVKHRLEGVDHGQRCTIMSRVARQFLYAAHFEPDAPRVSEAEYRSLVREVLDTSPRLDRPLVPPVVIPGYKDLRSLSREQEHMMKEELGGRWTGYFQRGNWRMIFAFSPRHQRSTARALVEDLERGHLPLVHIANFPRIDINHTALVLSLTETPVAIHFEVYDPNNAGGPESLVFDRATATFRYARTVYFPGGPAKVYEVYSGAFF